MSKTINNQPIQTLRVGSLKAAIWENEGKKGSFYSVTFSRSYKDDQGHYQDTQSIRHGDLLRLAKLADKVDSTITELNMAARSEDTADKASEA